MPDNSKYTLASLKELGTLKKLASAREADMKLTESEKIIKKWKSGNIQPEDAIKSMADMFAHVNLAWLNNADPGVPIAHAVVQGYLKKEDISPDTWDKIETLVTVAKI